MNFFKEIVNVKLMFQYMSAPNTIELSIELMFVEITDNGIDLMLIFFEVDGFTFINTSDVLSVGEHDVGLLALSATDIEYRIKFIIL